MSSEELCKTIEVIRMKLIEVGMSQGLTASDTIKLSEILDKLINIKMGV
ncbi:aspartyl-phosphate phosphatase Spo0E family protein [Neobacillus cucumis]|uniref:Aspartyl-phosphate phosphatase Spo0E family protein n=1 Tax=Neobacillus cucumis TaxID=1740721 RepID=A0A2N5HEQ9_9BACI|nr:aspartyl-phosphate phosphatase Spo0E family protein [Neobacillus cucumis]PLS04014.1 hypothetical protein CVD27_12705 [Neobacillus cucumis]